MRLKLLIAKLAPLFVCVGMVGCTTVGPDYKIPENADINKPGAAGTFASAQEKVFKTDALPDHWWKLYDDPVLNSLIEKSLSNNTDLRVASANLARAPCCP